MRMLLLRAMGAFLVLPGMVAFALPIWIGLSGGPPDRYPRAALAPLAAGVLLLVWCVREFYVAGRGTLAPWDPPRHLVVSGPYRFSRNPMYIAVITVQIGWCLLWNSNTLILYTALFALGFHLRVLLFEEPWAQRQFGHTWSAYRSRVPRWIIRIRT
jgi:protein-S-isoprenylcysteine O-methyltransferase Ste14